MGFRSGAYASVFSVVKGVGNYYDVRLCTSRRNRQTGVYEQDFGGFVRFAGDAATKIAKYEGSDAKNNGGRPIVRVRLGDVDTTNSYNANRKITYTNHTVFTFDYPNEEQDNQQQTTPPATEEVKKDIGEYVNVADSADEEELFT